VRIDIRGSAASPAPDAVSVPIAQPGSGSLLPMVVISQSSTSASADPDSASFSSSGAGAFSATAPRAGLSSHATASAKA
jgi:hypothetical protein